MKLSIGKKILLGYIPVIILLISLSSFTLFRLNQVNKINREITSVDVVVNNTAENLIDILLTQESFAQRYIILKSQDILSLFKKRELEFYSNFQKIKNLPVNNQFSYFNEIEEYNSEYKNQFEKGILNIDSIDSRQFAIADSLRKKAFNNQVALINKLISDSRKNQLDKTWKIGEIGRVTFRTVYLVSITGIILILLLVMFISRGILKAIKTLKTATNYVSRGKFYSLPSVKNEDELGDLSLAFNEMADRLKQLEEIYKDSSPLTRLPGGISIENIVIKKISDNIPFAFCMLDLDNFKPFNDRYGYSRGNAVIKNTARIIKESCQKYGNKTDFIGHIGGDDFALITSSDKYEKICNTIIELFDKKIIEFYNPEDRDKGFILSKNRRDEKLSFPIMTISISVINTEKSYVENYIEVGEIIAELKKYAKSFSKSNMVVDRRGGKKRQNSKGPAENIEKVLADD
ncbi:MAG: diguanylate cyclase [Chitinispirillia bacterium]|jgi:GGDEF domain-containing protein/CHASE3 domain sensor protein